MVAVMVAAAILGLVVAWTVGWMVGERSQPGLANHWATVLAFIAVVGTVFAGTRRAWGHRISN